MERGILKPGGSLTVFVEGNRLVIEPGSEGDIPQGFEHRFDPLPETSEPAKDQPKARTPKVKTS